jgi:hypothetical protein
MKTPEEIAAPGAVYESGRKVFEMGFDTQMLLIARYEPSCGGIYLLDFQS